MASFYIDTYRPLRVLPLATVKEIALSLGTDVRTLVEELYLTPVERGMRNGIPGVGCECRHCGAEMSDSDEYQWVRMITCSDCREP